MTVQHTFIIDFPSVVHQRLCLYRGIKYIHKYPLFVNPTVTLQSTFKITVQQIAYTHLND